MAIAMIKMPDEFLMKLSKLGDKTDEIVSKTLKAGGEVVLDKVKANLKGVIGNQTKLESRSTGELVSSLGLSPTKLDKNGNFNVKIGFNEPRSDGDSNAKIANILEYGKSGQPPRPFLKSAKSASRKACIETMKLELDKEIENL